MPLLSHFSAQRSGFTAPEYRGHPYTSHEAALHKHYFIEPLVLQVVYTSLEENCTS